MPKIELTPAQRKEHRSAAHHLDPVVMIGGDGVKPTTRREIDTALNVHGLIKIRLQNDDREERAALLESLADEFNAAPIQSIGKLLVLWRPPVAKEKPVDENRMPGPRDVKVLKYSSRGGQRPQVQVMRVLGNQRLTPGGTIKKSRPKKSSIKRNPPKR